MSHNSNHSTQSDWLSRIAGNDETAFNELYRFTSGNIYNAVVTYVKAAHVAEEIVQDVYVRLWKNREKLAGVENIENYLFVLARNAAMDHFRNVTARQKLLISLREVPETFNENGEALLIEKEYHSIYKKAVAELPEQQQRVYRLAQEQEMRLADIAFDMGLSRSTVKKHLELARRFVREYVNNHIQYCLCGIAVSVIFFLSR